MKSRDLASLVFKIIGVIVLIKSIDLFPHFVNTVWGISLTGLRFVFLPILLGGLLLGLYLGVGLILILASKQVAKLVCKEDHDINVSCTAQELQVIAFSCIGIWLICSSAVSFIINMLHYFKASQDSMTSQIVGFSMMNVSQMLIGIILFLQSRGLSNLWEKLNESRNPVHKD